MDMFEHLEIILFAMVLKDVVEGAKCHPRACIAACPCDVVLGGVVLHLTDGDHGRLDQENVVHDSEGDFVGGYIVEGEE